MNKIAASVAKVGTSYLDGLDKVHDLTTTLYGRVDSAGDKAAAALRIPSSMAAVVSRPRRGIIGVQRKVADKAHELHKAQINKLIARVRGQLASA